VFPSVKAIKRTLLLVFLQAISQMEKTQSKVAQSGLLDNYSALTE
jgi:hypothetical protein